MPEGELSNGPTLGAASQEAGSTRDPLREAVEAVLEQQRVAFGVGWEHFAASPKDAVRKVEAVLGPAIVQEARRSAGNIPANGFWRQLFAQVGSAVNELLSTHGNSDSALVAFRAKMIQGKG